MRTHLLAGVKESDTGLAHPGLWDLHADKHALGQTFLQVARCTKIIASGEGEEHNKCGACVRLWDSAAAGTSSI